jgi:predicted metal-dependent enzyme (double-stranded beta helix superfamily)
MAYALDDFCTDLNRIVKAEGVAGLSHIAEKLEKLLGNPAFVAETFTDDTPKGKRTLHFDAETGAYVLAHVHLPGQRGKPHSHGASWAVYGNARGYTKMIEWARTNPEAETHSVLRPNIAYRLEAGEARAYGPHVVHSTEHPEKAWVIRVTGTKFSDIPRYHFNPETDTLIETV